MRKILILFIILGSALFLVDSEIKFFQPGVAKAGERRSESIALPINLIATGEPIEWDSASAIPVNEPDVSPELSFSALDGSRPVFHPTYRNSSRVMHKEYSQFE